MVQPSLVPVMHQRKGIFSISTITPLAVELGKQLLIKGFYVAFQLCESTL